MYRIVVHCTNTHGMISNMGRPNPNYTILHFPTFFVEAVSEESAMEIAKKIVFENADRELYDFQYSISKV